MKYRLRTNLFALSAMLMAIPLMSGCSSDVKRALGVNTTAPDEFAVMSHSPLSIPPTFSLRAPEEPVLKVEERSAIQEEAKKALFSDNTEGEKRPSHGENTLITKAGGEAEKDIRLILAEEYARRKEEKSKGVKRFTSMIPWIGNKEDVINAAAERERLQETLSKGASKDEREKSGSEKGA
ncbi:MAG: hypothetical protein K0R63_1834 [Rickettsiales bacterium]|jgi:hypothetical protein|nr:hypothetical protein [Rickettsiales bacterium]